jgi:hypothetical protein
VALSYRLRPLSRSSRVVDPMLALAVGKPSWPRFRAINEEGVSLDDVFGPDEPGVLVDAVGAVRALYASYVTGQADTDLPIVLGLPSALFAPPIAAMVAARDATTPRRSLGACAAVPPFLDVELEAISGRRAGPE